MYREKPYCLNRPTISLIVLGMLAFASIPTPVFAYAWEQCDVYTNSVEASELPYIVHSPAQPGRFLFSNRGITDDAGETARSIDLPSGYYQFDQENPNGLFRIGYYSPTIDSSLISLEYTADLGSTWTTLLVWEGELDYECRDNIRQSPVDPDLIYMVDPPIDMGPYIWQAPFLRSRDHGLTWDTLYFETYYIPLRTKIYDIIPSPIDTNTAIFVLREDYFEDQTVLRVTHDAGESWTTSSVDSFQYWFGTIGLQHSDFVIHAESPESLFGFIKTGPDNIWAVASGDTVLGEYDSVYLDYPHVQSIQTAWFDGNYGLYLKCHGGELQDTLYRYIWPDIYDYKPIDDIPTFHNVSRFSFHPNHPDTIIACHWSIYWPGVIRSTDSGETWSACQTGQNGALTSVFASKHLPNVVYATSWEAALYKSTDYGATWDTVFGDWPDNPRYNGRINDIASFFESPLDERILVLPFWSDTDDSIQIIRSRDAGEHWEDGDIGIVDSLHFKGPNFIYSAPDDDSLWFAGYGRVLYCHNGLTRSSDAGENWEMIIDTMSYGHFFNSVLAITSSFRDIGYMYSGGWLGISFSTDYGSTWSRTCYHRDSLDVPYPYPNITCHALLSIPSPFYFTFASLDLAQIDSTTRPFFVRTYDHVHWDTLETVRDSFKVKCMASDPTHPATRIFAAGTHWFSGEGFHTVIESNDGGDTWQDIGPSVPFLDDDLNYFGDGMILTQDNLSVSLDGRYLYLSTTKNGIYRCELPPMGISEEYPVTKPEVLVIDIWPNPFNSAVNISYELRGRKNNLTIEIYNINGSLVWGMEKGNIEAGYYSETWNGTDENGLSQPSGVYLIRMEAGDNSVTQKAILLK